MNFGLNVNLLFNRKIDIFVVFLDKYIFILLNVDNFGFFLDIIFKIFYIIIKEIKSEIIINQVDRDFLNI